MKRLRDFRDQLPRGLSGLLIDAQRQDDRREACRPRLARMRARHRARAGGASEGRLVVMLQ